MFREFSLQDTASIVAMLNDEAVSKWTSNIPFPYTQKDAIDWINQQKLSPRKPLAIEFEEKLVGCISHWPLDSETTEVGYWIGKDYWGKGIATAALSAMIACPTFPQTANIAAKVVIQNTGSRRVLEKCNFAPSEKCKVTRSGHVFDALLYIRHRK